MQSTSNTKFEEYVDLFYPLPHLPAFLKDQPDFGCWTCPENLPDNWAMKHFIENIIAEKRYKFLEDHAFTLRTNVPCHVVLNEVIAGGKHVVLKVEFEDGVVWIARIMFPRCEQSENHKCMGGYLEENFDERTSGMESEIATLKYVTEATSVPAPKVYGYDLRRCNNVGGPYMLMEMIHGETVAQRIKRQGGISGSEVQRILAQMAGYLVQLSNLRFEGPGRLRFHDDAKFSHCLELFDTGTFSSSAKRASAYFISIIYSRVRRHGINEKDLLDPPPGWTGADWKEKTIIAGSIYCRTAMVLASEFTEGPFPLQHLDLNQQNIILDDNGNVTGILDWEDAKVVPFECYDITSRLLFKQWWQVWEGLDWVDEFAYLAFEEAEANKPPKLSLIHLSRMGEIGRKLNPLTFLDFSKNISELITLLYGKFEDQAEAIVSKYLAEQIIEAKI